MDAAMAMTGGERAARVLGGLLVALGGAAGAFFSCMVWFWTGYEGGRAAVPGWTCPAVVACALVALAGLRLVWSGALGR